MTTVTARPQLSSCFYPLAPDLIADLFESNLDMTEPPAEVFPDLDAAERVIAAYHHAQTEDGWPVEGMWETIQNNHHGSLVAALERSDTHDVAEQLERMFASELTMGLSMASELDTFSSRRDMFGYASRWFDGFLALAAYLGLVCEKADSGHILNVEATEDFLGLYGKVTDRVDVGFPRVCSAWGIECDGVLVPRAAWRWIHSAHQILRLTGPGRKVVEVGGGFGAVAYYLHGRGMQHVLYDLPLTNALAGYFLIRAGVDVSLLGEPPAGVQVLPSWRIEEETHADLVFNQDSIPEMPLPDVVRYLEVIDRIADVFYSENQEDGAVWYPDEIPQVRLPDVDHHMVRLTDRQRWRAWMRRGHIESIYRP